MVGGELTPIHPGNHIFFIYPLGYNNLFFTVLLLMLFSKFSISNIVLTKFMEKD